MSNTILEVQTRFNDWITFRINEYNFVENQDFVIFTEKSVKMQRGRPGKEYSLSISMAKELAMIEKTEQGKMARLYFKSCLRLKALFLLLREMIMFLHLCLMKKNKNKLTTGE